MSGSESGVHESLKLSEDIEADLFWTECAIRASESENGICSVVHEDGYERLYHIDYLMKIVSPVSRNKDGFTPLMSAVRSGNIPVFEQMLLVIKPLEIALMVAPDNGGGNIIHYAAMSNNLNMLKNVIKSLVLKVGGNMAIFEDVINEEGPEGKTPLDLAIINQKDLEIIKFLLENGCGVKNYEALMNSVINYKEAADLLVSNGALKELGVDGQEALDEKAIVNLIIENLDIVAASVKDNGSCLANILKYAELPEIQSLLSKSGTIIAATLLGGVSEAVGSYNERSDEDKKITSYQASKIKEIIKFGHDVIEELRAQEHRAIITPEAASVIAIIDLLKEKVLLEDEENYPEWRASKYDHPEMTDLQKQTINKVIEKFFPAQTISTKEGNRSLKDSKGEWCTIQ
jgi:hypothetical protein